MISELMTVLNVILKKYNKNHGLDLYNRYYKTATSWWSRLLGILNLSTIIYDILLLYNNYFYKIQAV
jgi:hypothetical protein